MGRLLAGLVGHDVGGVDDHGYLLPWLIDVDAVVLLDDLQGLALYIDIVLDIQAVVLAALHHAIQRQLAVAGLHVDVEPLQADIVVLGGVQRCAAVVEVLHQRRLQPVDVADEVAHELGGGVVVDLVGGADLLDDALVEHGDAVGQGQGLLLVVGDVDGGDAEVLLHLLQLIAQLDAELGVQVGQRISSIVLFLPFFPQIFIVPFCNG